MLEEKIDDDEELSGKEKLKVAATAWLDERAAKLKKLKGKFVPWGPKPWDEHHFTKVSLSVRLLSKQAQNTRIVNQCIEEVRRISGMHPKIVLAKKNIAELNWREGMKCGVKANINGPRMYDFLNRLNTIILPRVRDFEGLNPNSFNRCGDFAMGFTSQDPFKELDSMIDEREITHGFGLRIVNNCMTKEDGIALFKKFGFPIGDPQPRKPRKIKAFGPRISRNKWGQRMDEK